MNFVKPNLLGTLREFKNRFVNPITNGQHRDSTAVDVRLMKRRAHILHEMLLGCVQVGTSTQLCVASGHLCEYCVTSGWVCGSGRLAVQLRDVRTGVVCQICMSTV